MTTPLARLTSRKLAIIGAGSVGASIAYATLIRGHSPHVVLYDVNEKKVGAEVLDLNHGLQFVSEATVEGGSDLAICRDAAVVVITAGAKQKPGQTRLDLAEANVKILRELLPRLLEVAPDAIYLLVSNPVDVLTDITQQITGLPRARVLGSGTVLDSSRFRFLIARRLRVAVSNVHAYIAGEHGDSEIPLWSSASISGIPLHEWAVPGHGKLSVRDRTEIVQEVKESAYKIVEGKGATHHAIGLATATILEAIFDDEQRVLPVSARIENYQGMAELDGVCLSLPSIVGAKGVEPPLPIPLNPAERAGLINSAQTIRDAVKRAGF
jgi:L-lactate dehydrogenase